MKLDFKKVFSLRDATRNYRYGEYLIKTGHKAKGVSYVSFALLEMSLLPGLISNLLNSV